MEEVVLLLGSNMGRRVRRLREGVAALTGEVKPISVSRVYAGAPAVRPGQPWFLNLAVLGTTALAPEDLLLFVKGVEARFGRKAGPSRGPRELDVDIVLMDDRVVREPHLIIPHPALGRRRSCLVPVAEVAPDLPVPPEGKIVRQLLAGCRDPLVVIPL